MSTVRELIDTTAPRAPRFSQRLRAIIAREARAGAPPGLVLTPYRDWFEATYGAELVAVLLYGSVLSPALASATSTPDFIVVTDHGRPAAHSRLTRLVQGGLPPTSRSALLAADARPFKYLHLDLGQLAATTGPGLRDLFVAGRLSKQVRILHARDDAAAEAVIDAVVASVLQLAPLVLALLPPRFDGERFMLDSLAISYRGEWRIEAPDKVQRLADAGRAYYHELYQAVLEQHLVTGQASALGADRYAVSPTRAERRRALSMLRRTRWRAALRWPKHAITAAHAGELVLAKLERAHPGMRIPAFVRRHPLICALPFLLWLLWRGVVRARTATHVAPRLRVALIVNLAARTVRRRGFDAAAHQRILGRDTLVRAVASWEALRHAVAEACERGVDAIAVLGGDGTLGGIVSEMLLRAPERAPALVPLCGGGFNLAARALGARRSPWSDLKCLARRVERGLPLVEHSVRVLRVDDPEHLGGARHGFVFGAGVVFEYSRHITDHGGTGWWNSMRRTVSLTFGAYAGTARASATWRQFAGMLRLDRAHLPLPAFTAVMACALVARSRLFRPLPATRAPSSGTFVYLASALSRQEILRRRLFGVLRGSFRSERHVTGHASALELDSGCGYLLDGELVLPCAGSRALVVSAGPAVRFWLPRGHARPLHRAEHASDAGGASCA